MTIYLVREEKKNALGDIIIYHEKPTYDKGKWRGIVLGHAPSYMYPEIKNGECVEFISI